MGYTSYARYVIREPAALRHSLGDTVSSCKKISCIDFLYRPLLTPSTARHYFTMSRRNLKLHIKQQQYHAPLHTSKPSLKPGVQLTLSLCLHLEIINNRPLPLDTLGYLWKDSWLTAKPRTRIRQALSSTNVSSCMERTLSPDLACMA